MFTIDIEVQTPAGTGMIVYAEDVYIEVSIAGNDVSFESPFNRIN